MDNGFELKEKKCITFLKRFNNKTYTCFSGGKDSLVALDLAVKSDIKKVVFCDTTIEFQETLDYIEQIENYYDLKIEVVSAPRPFFDIVHKIGFPSRSMRWCCKVYKFSPLAIFARNKNVLSYITGLRGAENARRKNYKKIDMNHYIKIKQLNPILDWSDQEVWTYIQKYKLPINPLYDMGFKRVGCWPCPFKTKADWNLIEKNFPDKYALLQNTLRHILKDCEGHGIINLSDFIKNYKWSGYRRPQNSELKGKIEVMPEITIINLEDSKQLEKLKQSIPILSKDYEVIRNSIIIKKKLQKQKVKILVEKSLNCVGCGACVALCESLNIQEEFLVVDANSCKSCLKCINTSLMRGACIMRNYAPYRFEVRTCQDLMFENDDISLEPDSRIGLIRTRTSIENLTEKLKEVAEIKKYNQYLYIKNGEFRATAYKSKGFVEIKIYPKNNELEKAMNYFRKAMA